MEFNEVAVTRKSIRKYAARPVAKEDIEAMLRCAMEAPSWKNSQTARYHVITSSTMLQAMKQEGLAPFNAENTKDAPVLIVTSFVKDVSGFDKDGTPSNELGNLWGAYDLGLHNENLILVVVALVLIVSLVVALVVVIEVVFEILRRMLFVVFILMISLFSFNVST